MPRSFLARPLAPISILDHRLHQGNQVLKVGLETENFLTLELNLHFSAIYSSRQCIGDEVICGATARANNRDTAGGSLQDGNIESFRTVRRDIGIRSLIQLRHLLI